MAFAWTGPANERLLAVVNYGPTQGQCYVALPWSDLGDRSYLLRDRLSDAAYERAGTELMRQGLYVDLPDWRYHLFELRAV